MFSPNPALLKRILALKAPVRWASAIALTEDLGATGFGPASSEMGQGPEQAMAVTQALSRQGTEVAIAYFARNEEGLMAESSLAWIAASPTSPEDFSTHVAAVRAMLEGPSVLGAATISLDQAQAWIGVGAPDNEVILSLAWAQLPAETPPATPASDVEGYRNLLRSLPGRVVTASITASRDPLGKWSLHVLIIA